MNRREFMEKLKGELSKLPPEELEAAVEYYEEYFDEAGAENEQKVIEELGSPKKVAGQIKSEYAVRLFDESEKPTAKKGLSAVWYVIIGICSAPVSIPLVICAFALAIAIFVSVICCIIGVLAGIIGFVVAAIACIVVGIMSIPVALSTSLLLLGTGIGCLGVLAAMAVLLFIGIKAATRAIVRAARKRNERKRIKQLVDINENKKWRYSDETPNDSMRKNEDETKGGEDDE